MSEQCPVCGCCDGSHPSWCGQIMAVADIVESCPSCHQPSDEPCPSSCGVDMAAPGGDKTAYFVTGDVDIEALCNARPGDVIWMPEAHAMSHPKAQGPSLSPEQWVEIMGCELEAKDAELATLRAQLEAKETQASVLGEFICDMRKRLDLKAGDDLLGEVLNMQSELERLRPVAIVANPVAKSVANLLLQSPVDHRLGQGNRLDGEPEYHEPKPVISVRPLL